MEGMLVGLRNLGISTTLLTTPAMEGSIPSLDCAQGIHPDFMCQGATGGRDNGGPPNGKLRGCRLTSYQTTVARTQDFD